MSGIPLGSNFFVTAAIPLDQRATFDTVALRDALDAGRRYEGLKTYCKDTQKNYFLKGGILNVNWTEEGTGTGGGSSSTPATINSQQALANNATTTISLIGEKVSDCASIIVEYYGYRVTTVSGAPVIKKISGMLRMESAPDAVGAANKWVLNLGVPQEISTDGSLFGISFGLISDGVDKSTLTATLDNMAGTGHSCILYFTATRLFLTTYVSIPGTSIVLANNAVTLMPVLKADTLTDAGIVVSYFVYRKTASGFILLSGKLKLEGQPDTTPKFDLNEAERMESIDSGVTFQPYNISSGVVGIQATLTNLAGSGPCTLYYITTVFPK